MTGGPKPQDAPPLLGITAQDAGMDRMLRESVRTLRNQHSGTPLGEMLGDVLAGRRTLRDVARTPEWDAAVAPATERMAQQWAELSTEERERLVAEGQAELERQRAAVFQERFGPA